MKNIWKKINKPILALAPMAGYTDSAFRLVCLKNNADMVYTEMVSVEALWRKNKRTLKMLELLPGEKNIILQLFGNNPESFKKALKIITSYRLLFTGYSGIDINLGCPAKKVYSTGAGAALMDNKKLARKIIQITLKNTKLPVSIKIRSQVKNTSAIEFIKYISDLPISAVMIHGRSLKQGFAGAVDFKMIREVKKLLPNIPVLANGGVCTFEDAKNLLNKTNADGIGIARGALGNPWVFFSLSRAIKSPEVKTLTSGDLESRSCPTLDVKDPVKFSQPSKIELNKIILTHAKLFLKYSDDLVAFRKHLTHYIKGQKNASELRQKMIRLKTLDELKKVLFYL